MFLTELFEQQTNKHASFCFGRMNPPTVGHAQLINTVANSAQGGDYFIFTSQSHDAKKNPLDYPTKVKFLKALFPDQAGHIVYDTSLKTVPQVAQWLYEQGYRSVTFVAGGDRLPAFKELLTAYNGKEGGNVYYKFDSINFVSSGDRDPDADGVAGVSASSAREAASRGDMEAFAQATGAGKLAQPLYDAVRKGMLLTEGRSRWDGYTPEQQSAATDGWYDTMDQRGDDTVKPVSKNPYGPEEQILHDSYEFGYKGAIRKIRNIGSPAWASKQVDEHIVKHGSEYRILSKKTGKNMGTFPSKAAAKKHEREIQYFKHANEDSSGYIPKNKREAKDPRWSNALTVDVHPDTPNKNLKAFKLA